MHLIPFHREHFNLLEAREYERKCVIPYFPEAFFNLMESLPHCYTMVGDGRIITCMGIVPMWTGVWELWQVPSVYVRRYAKDYVKIIRGQLDTAAERINVWRFQTISPADELHDRWMEFIGFECEGTLKEYSRFKIDHRIWARRYNHGG